MWGLRNPTYFLGGVMGGYSMIKEVDEAVSVEGGVSVGVSGLVDGESGASTMTVRVRLAVFPTASVAV